MHHDLLGLTSLPTHGACNMHCDCFIKLTHRYATFTHATVHTVYFKLMYREFEINQFRA